MFGGYGANDVACWMDMHSRMNIQVVTDVINPCCFIFDRLVGRLDVPTLECYVLRVPEPEPEQTELQ